MNVLLRALPVRGGHFIWCPVERTLGHRDCYRCQGQLYGFASIFAGLVTLLEFSGYRWTGSQSLWGDAWHVGSDFVGYLIGLGYAGVVVYQFLTTLTRQRFKEFSEFLLGALLVLSGWSILVDSVLRFWSGRVPEIEHVGLLIGIAFIGLVANVILFALFWSFGIEHDHDNHGNGCCGHEENLILKGNLWHTFGDTGSSLLVVMNGCIFWFSSEPGLRYLDLVGAAGIAIILLWHGLGILARNWKGR